MRVSGTRRTTTLRTAWSSGSKPRRVQRELASASSWVVAPASACATRRLLALGLGSPGGFVPTAPGRRGVFHLEFGHWRSFVPNGPKTGERRGSRRVPVWTARVKNAAIMRKGERGNPRGRSL